MYRTVVTICTAKFGIQQFLLSAHTLYLCVLCGSQNKQQFFPLYNINWLVFITETVCVYCAVRTGSFYYN
jgi:hypothetical protein